MQIRNFLFLVFMLFGGLALLTACSSPPETPASVLKPPVGTKGVLKTPTVRLHIAGNPKAINITTSGGGQCNNANPNCIEVPKFDQSMIGFELTPISGWRFSEFKLCVGATKDTQVCDLNVYQQVEFEASVQGGAIILNPDEHGEIELAPLSPNLNDAFTAFQVLDKNWVANDYFYSIKVCPTGDPEVEDDCVWTDPPIINGGMGGRGGGN